MTIAGSAHNPNVYYEDMYITEAQKAKSDYLKGNMDHWIAQYTQLKPHIKTYRNYYSGIRNAKEFKYLTENFGIGTPASLKFTNLIKARVDSLVAQLESDSYTYTASCVDDKTIDTIQQQKKESKLQEITASLEAFTTRMKKAVSSEQPMPGGTELSDSLDKIASKYSTNFLSDFEIAAQNVCTYFEKSNAMDLRQKLATLVHDLIVTGECYWRVHYDRLGADPILTIIKPENIFHNKNTNTPYLKGSDAIVHREYMTHKEVAAAYGKYMTNEQMKELFGGQYMSKYARSLNSGIALDAYYSEDDPILGQRHFSSAYTVEVVHVEWLATNEVKIDGEEQELLLSIEEGINYKANDTIRRMDRYEGVRIGGTQYVNCGKAANIPRSQNDPYACDFSYGGVINNDRDGKPYSVVGALKDLQDIYDMTIFYRDNLMANSGVQGDRVNVAGIPKVLGKTFMERLFKFIALKKNGLELIDPTEQGAQLFQHYGSFDNTVNGNSLIAIESLLGSIEKQADVIAGTNPFMLGQIQERDAVSNVSVGIKQSLMVNQSMFQLFRANQTNLMSALLTASQTTYKHGKKIAYIAGSESFVYDILPDKFAFTDYALAISYASKDLQKLSDMKIFAKELISNQLVDPDVMTKVILSDSITEVSKLITDNWRIKKQEMNELGQAKGNVEQLEASIKDLTAKLGNAEQQLEASKNSDSQIKRDEVQRKTTLDDKKLTIEEQKANNTKEFNDKQIELKEQVVQLEREQLYMAEGNAKEVKNL